MKELIFENTTEWHVLKGKEQMGPFSYAEMLRMKQDSLLFDFDYVWSLHLENWCHAGELPEFSSDRINRIFEKSPSTEVFRERSSRRKSVSLTAVAHDNERIYKAQIQSISMGGCLVSVQSPVLLPGQQLMLHVPTQKECAGFNLMGTVRNKSYTRNKLHATTTLAYTLVFGSLPEPSVKGLGEMLDLNENENKSEKKGSL